MPNIYKCKTCGEENEENFYPYLRKICKPCRVRNASQAREDKKLRDEESRINDSINPAFAVQFHYAINNEKVCTNLGASVTDAISSIQDDLTSIVCKNFDNHNLLSEYIDEINTKVKSQWSKTENENLYLRQRIDFLTEKLNYLIVKSDKLENEIFELKNKSDLKDLPKI